MQSDIYAKRDLRKARFMQSVIKQSEIYGERDYAKQE